jgi:hypothetical protein
MSNVSRLVGLITSVALLLAATACGDASRSRVAGPAKGVRLSVPPRTATATTNLVVEQVGLPAGSWIKLYAYRAASASATPTCQGGAQPAGQVQVRGDARQAVPATLDDGPGRYWWVVVASGYTSGCGAAGSSTQLLATPQVAVLKADEQNPLSDNPPAGQVGKPYRFAVQVDTAPAKGSSWVVEATWYGPFASTPAAVEAGCRAGTDLTATVNVTSRGATPSAVTPTQPGVYRVVASIAPTDEVAAASSGCDDNAPFVVVS